VELVDCTFTGRLRKAIFNGSVPEEQRSTAGRARNEFCGNDFSAMDLVDVAFRTGIDLSLPRLPTGPRDLYLADAAGSVQRARTAVVGWGDLAVRREAVALISVLQGEVEGGQRQLLLRMDDDSGPREALDLVFRLLAGE
jgi:hypothetical protein